MAIFILLQFIRASSLMFLFCGKPSAFTFTRGTGKVGVLTVAANLLMVAGLTSCSFNKAFYPAEKIPKEVKKITIKSTIKDANTGRDTVLATNINIGANYQPTFTDANNSEYPLKYTIESIVFKSESGSELCGWFIKPKTIVHPDITLLFLHGNGGNVLSEHHAGAELAAKGFQVFVFDYSGYGFSDGTPTHATVLQDASSALKLMHSREDVRNTKLIIYGQSLGGQLAATVARNNEALTDGLVMEGAFSSHKDIAARIYGLPGRIVVKEEYSAVRSIKDYHKPLLLIHSTEDETVPFSMGEKIFDHANQPKTFYAIKHGHIEGPRYYADSIAYKIRSMVKNQ